jgi:hypothetical protein
MTTTRGTQERQLGRSLSAASLGPEYAAIEAMARRVARGIDAQTELETLDPKLVTEYRLLLVQLGLTPHARAQMSGKGAQPAAEKPKSALQRQRDELAERRARQATP